MGTRELIILILGLAVVAVILRGLYLAMQARRGQLRLAIDKHIPQDVDLNALELAELPNGGARLVARSLRQVNAFNQQNDQDLDLGGEAISQGPIPVLMDTVALGEARVIGPATVNELEDEFDDGDYDDDLDDDELDDDDLDADYDDEELDDADDVVVAPIADDEEFDDDDFDDAADDEDLEDDDEEFDPYGDEDEDDDEFDEFDDEEDEEELLDPPGRDGLFEDDDEYGFDNRAERKEPEVGSEDDLEEFDNIPMTAGERIGGPAPATQSSLFDDEPVEEKVKKPSLLQRFGDRNRNRNKPRPAAETAIATNPAPPKPAEAKDIRAARVAREQKVETRPLEPSEVLVINVMAHAGEVFHGDDLLQVLITSGLKFGDMNIFHQRLNNTNNGPVLFSVANILNPGTFDLNRMGEFTTRGVSLFLSMPAVISNREALDMMLKVAQQIRGALDGELKDDHRNVMTAQTIEHYRQRVRDFELRRLKAAQG